MPHRLTVGVAPEGVSRPITAGVGDDVCQLRGGDETDFELGHAGAFLSRAGG